MKRFAIVALTPLLLAAFLLASIRVTSASVPPRLIHDDDIPVPPMTSSVHLDENDAGSNMENDVIAPPPVSSHTYPVVAQPSPIVQTWMDSITIDAAADYVSALTGERPVSIDGQPYTIVSRNTFSGEPLENAVQYVGERMEALGLDVEYHEWTPGLPPSVIGQFTGTIDPDKIFIISAHMDNLPTGDRAPGADDNATGTTAVLLAADTLSPYQWGCTLRFTLWTGEEQGLLGSANYAARSHANEETIFGVMNFDMIGWNTPDSPRDIDIHAKSTVTNSVELAELFEDVIQVYQLDLIPEIVPLGTSASDHASFWNWGYPAILGIEDYYPGRSDFNPHYHLTEDRLEHLDIDYFTTFVRAALGGFTHMSDCLIVGALKGHVSTAAGQPVGGASISAVSPAGHIFKAVTDVNGNYTLALPVTMYTVTTEATGYLDQTANNVEPIADSVTVQDFVLTPEPTRAEVAVDKRLNTFSPVREGQMFDFIVTVTNTGNVTLTHVPLTDAYDTDYLRFVDSQPPANNTDDDGQIDWSSLAASLVAGESVTVTTQFLAETGTNELQPGGATVNSAAVHQASGNPDDDESDPAFIAPSRVSTATVRILTATAVDVTATHLLDHGSRIILQWQTMDETGVVGFHVVRQAEGGDPVAVTEAMIEAEYAGRPQWTQYTYVDEVESRRVDYAYTLQVVASDGTVDAVTLGTVASYPAIFLPMIVR